MREQKLMPEKACTFCRDVTWPNRCAMCDERPSPSTLKNVEIEPIAHIECIQIERQANIEIVENCLGHRDWTNTTAEGIGFVIKDCLDKLKNRI